LGALVGVGAGVGIGAAVWSGGSSPSAGLPLNHGGQSLKSATPPRAPSAGGGNVTIFNPTGSDLTMTVNGKTQFAIRATSQTANWLPATGRNPLPRSASGQPSDGQFGWDNVVLVSSESGGGQVESARVSIPRSLQTINDLQLYLFYDDDPTQAVWILMWQGQVVGRGGMS